MSAPQKMLQSVVEDKGGKTSLEDLLAENGRLEKMKSVFEHQRKHVLARGTDNTFIPASLNYTWYNHQWLRDTSKGIMHTLAAIDFAYESGTHFYMGDEIKESESNVAKTIDTMWKALDFFVESASRGGVQDISKMESKLGKNHILARFDVDEDSNPHMCEADKSQPDECRSWLMQYDGAPLVLLATKRFIDRYGTEKISSSLPIIKKSLPWITDYMMTFHNTPCADAWEQYYHFGIETFNGAERTVGKTMDSYTVSSLAAGVRAAKDIASLLEIKLSDSADPDKIEEFLVQNFVHHADIPGEKILSKSKIEYGETMDSIDSSAVEVFRLFKPKRLSGSDVERSTIKALERTLLSGNVLPVRYKFFGKQDGVKDTYFYGGRWFPNGLELAMYYIDNGNITAAKKIIEYVEERINKDGSIPEQELVDPVSPGYDPGNYFEKNGNSMITCLWWSETAYLAAVSKYLRARTHVPPIIAEKQLSAQA